MLIFFWRRFTQRSHKFQIAPETKFIVRQEEAVPLERLASSAPSAYRPHRGTSRFYRGNTAGSFVFPSVDSRCPGYPGALVFPRRGRSVSLSRPRFYSFTRLPDAGPVHGAAAAGSVPRIPGRDCESIRLASPHGGQVSSPGPASLASRSFGNFFFLPAGPINDVD